MLSGSGRGNAMKTKTTREVRASYTAWGPGALRLRAPSIAKNAAQGLLSEMVYGEPSPYLHSPRGSKACRGALLGALVTACAGTNNADFYPTGPDASTNDVAIDPRADTVGPADATLDRTLDAVLDTAAPDVRIPTDASQDDAAALDAQTDTDASCLGGGACGIATCGPGATAGTFASTPLGVCVNGQCQIAAPSSCGLYVCEAVQAACATSCSATDDTPCIAGAHCDGSLCAPALPDGSACDRDRACAHAHCQNGFCCASGDCCNNATDCPNTYATAPVCDGAAMTCQGHRGAKACADHACATGAVDDDSACGANLSKDCTPYQPVACKGSINQAAPVCPTSCSSNTECVGPANHCAGGQCVPYVGNGGACTTGGQCLSGNCWRGTTCCDTACNNTACDSCSTGTCNTFTDPYENHSSACNDAYDLGMLTATGPASSIVVVSTIENASDTEDWYVVHTSGATCNHVQFALTVPKPTTGTLPDFDLFLYQRGPDCDSNGLGESNGDVGQDEFIDYQTTCSAATDFDYYVMIHRYSGTSCRLPYTLTIKPGG